MVKKIISVVGLSVSFAMPNRHEIRLSSEGSSSRSWSMWRVGLGESCTPTCASFRSASSGDMDLRFFLIVVLSGAVVSVSL